MKSVTTFKTRGQETLDRLAEAGKQQPAQVQTFSATAAGAVIGGIILAAGAQGVLAVVALLAAPPVALTIGALGGGAVAWSYMQRHRQEDATNSPTTGPLAMAEADIANEQVGPADMLDQQTASDLAA